MEQAYGLSIPRTLEQACDSGGRMALLVYDMQVGVLEQISNGSEIVERVAGLVDAAEPVVSGWSTADTCSFARPRLLTDHRDRRFGHGDADAASRSLETLAFAGGSLQTDTATISPLLSAASVDGL